MPSDTGSTGVEPGDCLSTPFTLTLTLAVPTYYPGPYVIEVGRLSLSKCSTEQMFNSARARGLNSLT